MGLSALKVMSTVAGLALLPAVCLAQPAEFVDLGRFDDVTFRSLVQTPVITDVDHPVRWFAVTLPRISDPSRFLDIWTQNQLSFDTEIALYAPDGTLIATDDDDGADNHSALSFGITNVSAPQRLNPTAFSGQAAAVPNNGRDGAFSGPYPAGLGATAATYYIAVTEYNAIFANGFLVTHVGTPVGIVTSLAVRMNTPGGEFAPSVEGGDFFEILGSNFTYVQTIASANATAVYVDASAINGHENQPLSNNSVGFWDRYIPLNSPLSQLGPFPLVFRASNAIGDVSSAQATLTVRPSNWICQFADESPISSVPGTNVYTYDTRFADVDGPWTNTCYFSPPSGNDIWFRFVPSVNGTVSLSTCNADTGVTGSQPDTLLGMRRRCDDAGFFTCGDDVGGCGAGTRLSGFPVIAGQEYNIAVRSWTGDIINGRLAVTFVPNGPTCDSIDFNNDTSFFDPQDIEAFLSVYSEGPCIPATATCNDIDFNNDTSLFDPCDINSFLVVYSEGPCTPCGV